MFLRITAKAMIHRRGRLAVAAIALVVGSTITTALLSVYYDAARKMSRELRAYGANIMVSPKESASPKDNSSLDENTMDRLASGGWPADIIAAAPFLYIVAQDKQDAKGTAGATSSIAAASAEPELSRHAVVVAGTWLDQARRLSPWWQVKGNWIESRDDNNDCLIGAHLASQMKVNQNDRIELAYGAEQPSDATARMRWRSFTVAGILDTGGPEDDQVVVSLKAAQDLSGLARRLSAVAISASGGQDRVESLASSIAARLPGDRADLVRQISESEGRILGRLRLTMLLVALLILTAASLSVGTTLVALVMDRRKEIGTMKAIGAEGSDVLRLFLVELGGLGLCGGIIGYGLGIVVAQPIGRSLFSSAVAPRFAVFVIILIISFAVAMLSGILPIRRIKEVEPAVILKGD